MVYPGALVLLLSVCGFSLLMARRIAARAKAQLGVLQHRVDQHAHQAVVQKHPGETPGEVGLSIPLGERAETLAADVESLVDEVFQETNPDASSAALQQLLGYGVSIKQECLTARRGLMRIPSLSGAAVSIFVLAAVGFDSSAVRFALASLGLGAVTTGMCQLILARAKRTGQTLIDFVQMMERELLRAKQPLKVS